MVAEEMNDVGDGDRLTGRSGEVRRHALQQMNGW
jgi:hypothetical protein